MSDEKPAPRLATLIEVYDAAMAYVTASDSLMEAVAWSEAKKIEKQIVSAKQQLFDTCRRAKEEA